MAVPWLAAAAAAGAEAAATAHGAAGTAASAGEASAAAGPAAGAAAQGRRWRLAALVWTVAAAGGRLAEARLAEPLVAGGALRTWHSHAHRLHTHVRRNVSRCAAPQLFRRRPRWPLAPHPFAGEPAAAIAAASVALRAAKAATACLRAAAKATSSAAATAAAARACALCRLACAASSAAAAAAAASSVPNASAAAAAGDEGEEGEVGAGKRARKLLRTLRRLAEAAEAAAGLAWPEAEGEAAVRDGGGGGALAGVLRVRCVLSVAGVQAGVLRLGTAALGGTGGAGAAPESCEGWRGGSSRCLRAGSAKLCFLLLWGSSSPTRGKRPAVISGHTSV